MFIAHLPAGYILAKVLPLRRKLALTATALFFSIAPDLDHFWFYLVSDRRVPHHQYFFHWPLFWTALFGAAFLLSVILKKAAWRLYLLTGYLAALLHLVLDSFAAEIYWFAPFSDFHINAVTVPAVHKWWVWDFILHWTFALELIICAVAVVLFIRSRKACPSA